MVFYDPEPSSQDEEQSKEVDEEPVVEKRDASEEEREKEEDEDEKRKRFLQDAADVVNKVMRPGYEKKGGDITDRLNCSFEEDEETVHHNRMADIVNFLTLQAWAEKMIKGDELVLRSEDKEEMESFVEIYKDNLPESHEHGTGPVPSEVQTVHESVTTLKRPEPIPVEDEPIVKPVSPDAGGDDGGDKGRKRFIRETRGITNKVMRPGEPIERDRLNTSFEDKEETLNAIKNDAMVNLITLQAWSEKVKKEDDLVMQDKERRAVKDISEKYKEALAEE